MGKLYTKKDEARVVPLVVERARPEPYRTAWRRDYARVVHSAAFRRLQGKTQLLPGHESDFFRNRLTHSLEVAQIAKSIAVKLNHEAFKRSPIDTDIVEAAGLAHDLGHPPFGHNGEYALDECMKDYGGFEGNAQTLRILAKLEKRQTIDMEDGDPKMVSITGEDQRAGLNLAYRTLASVLKYDAVIGSRRNDRDNDKVSKGYYAEDSRIVELIKTHVPSISGGKFKTVECAIMDVADDIAYSTYDLEDAFKAGFLNPLSMMSQPEALTNKVAGKVSDRIKEYYPQENSTFTSKNVIQSLEDIFRTTYAKAGEALRDTLAGKIVSTSARPPYLPPPGDSRYGEASAVAADVVYATAGKVAGNGYFRTKLTSELVGAFIYGVECEYNSACPAQSKVRLNIEIFKRVEVLKNFVFESLIMSPRLKVTEHRGKQIVADIFNTLTSNNGHLLMADDARYLYENLRGEESKKRVVCDFIAGMTDRYAIQFYNRLFGTSSESIYSPI